ncbi:MAG: HU family DNA-binding protein [Bacteroidales bacterium]|nr:HU family DNA-binding protein [Candidatus Colimorpha merdihippi]MCQ2282770.1 HU family DNA-binding protein [Bacteroidales bacterium]
MTKAEIVSAIAAKTGMEKQAIQVIIDETMVTIKENMTKGENVYLRGFGTFEIIRRAQKTGRNISKNTSVIVPEHNIPKFKPCKEFMEMVK